MAKLIIHGEYRSSSICMKVIGYYVSIISVSIIDANNLDEKILLFLSLISFNLFLLKTWKIVQHTLVRYFVQTLFQFIQSLSTTEEHCPDKNSLLSKEIELFFIDLENFTFYFPSRSSPVEPFLRINNNTLSEFFLFSFILLMIQLKNVNKLQIS